MNPEKVRPKFYTRDYTNEDIVLAAMIPPEEPLPKFNISKLDDEFKYCFTPER